MHKQAVRRCISQAKSMAVTQIMSVRSRSAAVTVRTGRSMTLAGGFSPSDDLFVILALPG